MSVLFRLVCLDCGVGQHIGSSNSRTVEEPRKMYSFLRKHDGHRLMILPDVRDEEYLSFPDDELEID